MRLALALLAAVALGVAGCGNSRPKPDALQAAASRAQPTDWARRANAICTRTQREVEALGTPATEAELKALLPKMIRIRRHWLKSLRALDPPPGEERRVERLLRLYDAVVGAERDALAALRAGDSVAFTGAAMRLAVLGSRSDRLAIRLGAGRCTQEPPSGAG